MDVGRDEVGDVRVDSVIGVEEGDLPAGGLGLGESRQRRRPRRRAPGAAGWGLDEVAVDEGEGADAGAGEQGGGGGAGGSAADDGDVRSGEALLSGFADGAKRIWRE